MTSSMQAMPEADANLEWAIVWACAMPWILIIPFQTKVCGYRVVEFRSCTWMLMHCPQLVGLAHLGHELDVFDLWIKHQLRYTASPLHFLSDSSCQCNVIYRRYEGIWLTLDTPPL